MSPDARPKMRRPRRRAPLPSSASEASSSIRIRCCKPTCSAVAPRRTDSPSPAACCGGRKRVAAEGGGIASRLDRCRISTSRVARWGSSCCASGSAPEVTAPSTAASSPSSGATRSSRCSVPADERRRGGALRARGEARLAARPSVSPRTCTSFGIEDDGVRWIAMEFVEGVSLGDWLKARGPMPLAQFVPFFE